MTFTSRSRPSSTLRVWSESEWMWVSVQSKRTGLRAARYPRATTMASESTVDRIALVP